MEKQEPAAEGVKEEISSGRTRLVRMRTEGWRVRSGAAPMSDPGDRGRGVNRWHSDPSALLPLSFHPTCF